MATLRLSFSRICFLSLFLLIIFNLIHVTTATDEESTKKSDDTSTTGGDEIDDDDIAAQIAADEALEEIQDEDEEEDAGALDEDADSARYDPDLRHPLSILPPSSSDIHIGYSFISGLSSKSIESPLITLGKPIKLILAISNHGRNPFHIWGIIGSLNRDTNFNIHIQNFTYSLINYTIQSNDEISSTYEFIPNERLDIRPFQLALTIFYEARVSTTGNVIRGHSTTFYNQTVITEAGPQIISNTLFMIFFILFITAIGIGIYTWKKMEQQQENQKDSSSSTTSMTNSSSQKDNDQSINKDPSKNEWLEDALGINKPGSGKSKRKSKDKKN